jgi:hypothetical protein
VHEFLHHLSHLMHRNPNASHEDDPQLAEIARALDVALHPRS